MKRAALILLLIAILLALVMFSPMPGQRLWIAVLHNAAHAPIFGCIAVLVRWALRSHARFGTFSPARQYLIALVASSLLGAATEIAQTATGRDASLTDLGNDVLGALAFLVGFAAFDSRLRRRPSFVSSPLTRAAAVAIAVAALIPTAMPVARAALEYRERDQRFPILVDFSKGYDHFVWQQSSVFTPVSMPQRWARTAATETVLHVQFLAKPYPGIDLIEPAPDWSRYSDIALDLTNPTATPLDLVLRIHDIHHNKRFSDRFNKVLRVLPQSRTVLRVPLAEVRAGPRTRSMDMRQIAQLILFRSQGGGEMYLAKVWLE